MATYKVNGEEFSSFIKAIASAKSQRADVIETATGARRWTPAPQKTASRERHVFNKVSIYQSEGVREAGNAHQAHLDREHAANLAGNPGSGNPYHDPAGKFTSKAQAKTISR